MLYRSVCKMSASKEIKYTRQKFCVTNKWAFIGTSVVLGFQFRSETVTDLSTSHLYLQRIIILVFKHTSTDC